jgi:hypothetical protein
MDPVIIAFALLLGTIMISRFILIKGLGLLDSNEQSKVVVIFSKHRIWNLVAMLGFAAVYFLMITFQSDNYLILAYIYLGIVIAALFLSTSNTIQQFKKYKFNTKFIQYFTASNIVRGFGVTLFFVFILNAI